LVTNSKRIAPRRDDGFEYFNTETGAKGHNMEYFIGFFLALGISIGATAIGFDRERSFYPTVLMVIALLYALFAIMAAQHMRSCLNYCQAHCSSSPP